VARSKGCRGSSPNGGASGGIRDDGFVTAGTGFAQGFEGLRAGEQRGGIDFGDGTATGEGHGNGCGGDGVWHFGDGQDIKFTESEERGVDLAAELFDGGADGFQAVLRVLHQTGPGFLGVTDLVTKIGHGGLLCLAGAFGRFGDYALG